MQAGSPVSTRDDAGPAFRFTETYTYEFAAGPTTSAYWSITNRTTNPTRTMTTTTIPTTTTTTTAKTVGPKSTKPPRMRRGRPPVRDETNGIPTTNNEPTPQPPAQMAETATETATDSEQQATADYVAKAIDDAAFDRLAASFCQEIESAAPTFRSYQPSAIVERRRNAVVGSKLDIRFRRKDNPSD